MATMSFEGWNSISGALACWTGTMTAYVEPHTRFRDSKSVQKVASLDNGYYQIYGDEFSLRYLFPIYERYLDLRNGLLLTEHPDYGLEHDGKDRIVRPKAETLVDLVAEFPVARGDWYLPDPKHGIPQGNPTPGPPGYSGGIFLHGDWRPRVGPVWRGDYYAPAYDLRQSITLVGRTHYCFGVVVEAPWIPKLCASS
jgi:hypothetical protein